MIIILDPSRGERVLSLEVELDVLYVNGVEYDFSFIEEGDVLPVVDRTLFRDDITRKEGQIVVKVSFEYGVNAPLEARFPYPVYAKSGPVELPTREVVIPEPTPEVVNEPVWPAEESKRSEVGETPGGETGGGEESTGVPGGD